MSADETRRTQFLIAVHGIIRQHDKILVTHRSSVNDYKPLQWDFPGGKLEPGETPEQGLEREIQEETSLKVTIDSIDYIFPMLEELPEREYILLVYECQYIGGEITLNPEEHDEYRWVTFEELPKLDLIHFVRSWVENNG